MNLLEAQLAYPFDETVPAAAALIAVAPGVHWLRMPLPFALDHINLWLLQDHDGFTLVDCGVATDATRAVWEQLFAGPLRDKPIRRVIATHCHPDHVGLADWLCRRFDARLWMTTGEYAFARMMAASLPGVDGPAAIPHFQRHGLVDPSLLDQMGSRRSVYPTLVPAVPAAYSRLQEGQQVDIGGRRWRVIAGFGHSPEHAALYCEALQVLIAGDMVLPRISTNVSVFAVEPEGNPLRLYLDSLRAFADLPQETLVLPSHGRPFRGVHTRIAQLRAHHTARLAEVLEACRTPRSAMDIVPIMFRRQLDAHQLSFALGEALAHLHHLAADGLVLRQIHADGIVRFHGI